jgi:hypothetical protein
MPRRQTDGAHEGRAWDPKTGQVARGRPTVGDDPGDLERFREHVAKEAEARDLHRIAVPVGLDVEDLDLEQVAWFGSLHMDRAGERVHDIEVGCGDRL